MKRNTFTVLFALLALLSACMVLAAPLERRRPPPPPSRLFALDKPEENAEYHVGEKVYVHATNDDGSESEVYQKNPDVKLILQTRISLPDVNEVVVESISYRSLADHGIYFDVEEKYLLPERPNAIYRVRASFYVDGKHGYVDSAGFYLKP